jgi:hypothetical protein
MSYRVLSFLFVLLSIGSVASASTITYDFSIVNVSGPLGPGPFSGSFSFDSSTIDPGQSVTGPSLTALNFTLNGITYNASTANDGFLTFGLAGQLVGFCIANSFSSPGVCNVNSFSNTFLLNANQFFYATPTTDISETDGGITFSQVPEPGTFALLGTGLLSGVGVARRRLRAAFIRRM